MEAKYTNKYPKTKNWKKGETLTRKDEFLD
jgi:hypothetical protein